MRGQAKWHFGGERPVLQLTDTGDYRLDGIPLAFGGDPPGTAQATLEEINWRRAAIGLPGIEVTNTVLSSATILDFCAPADEPWTVEDILRREG